MTQEQALKILKTGANIFLTGEPGSGKTYTINKYVAYLRSHGIEPAITASTGIAATHIGGMTIHSWSGIGIKHRLGRGDLRNIANNDYVKKRVSKAKVLIIDEISMLPPGTLEMVDAICREVKENRQPFGGMQVVLVGDFFQLPPVVKKAYDEDSQEVLFEELTGRFSYQSAVWEQAEFITCYITEQYRQDDEALLQILSKIRGNLFDEISLNLISQRKTVYAKVPADAPKLYTHNFDVDRVNDQMLAKIPGEAEFFPMETRGHQALIAAMKKGCLSPESLYLKVGAAVMFTKNNAKEGYVNGTLGVVEGFCLEDGLPVVRTRSGRQIEVQYADWTVEEDGKTKGLLSQIPLRLAWAITVHKSQGISLDEAVVDLSKVFEFGQGYVALSRIRRLSGIYILGWNEVAFQVDGDVLKMDQDFRASSAEADKMFLKIPDQKLAKMHEDFILLCGGEIDSSKVIPKGKKKVSTYEETLKLWQTGANVAQIAKARKLNTGTIIDHLEKLVMDGKIKQDDIVRAVPQNLISSLPNIHAIFKKLETTKLSDVFKYFKGKYSYEDLKLARMTMKKI